MDEIVVSTHNPIVEILHPLVWSLCPDEAKQDSVMYGTEFGVVLLAKGPGTASIQEGLDCIRLYRSSLKGERYF